MKQYPSIPGFHRVSLGWHGIAFDKLDGSNMRAEWSAKRGWHKFGKRSALIGNDDQQLGHAVTLFEEKYADDLAERFADRAWKKSGVRGFVVFFEYVGPNSFAGTHPDPLEDMDVVLFDINATPKGFLIPQHFIDTTSGLHVPRIVSEGIITMDLVKRVRENEFDLTEGVVVKSTDGKTACKIKTQQWLDKIRELKGITDDG